MDDLLDVPESAAAAHRLALPSKFRASHWSSSGLLTKDGDGDDEENKKAENPSDCDRTILGSLDGEQDATTESTTVVSDEGHATLMSAGATAAAAATTDGPVFLQARLPEISAVQEPSLHRKEEYLQNENMKEMVPFVDEEKEPEVGTFVTVQEREASEFRKRLKSCLHQRDAEQEWLADIYRRLVTYGNNKEMILLTGPSGSGKTRLARAALQPLASDSGGYFLWGKFDQLNLASPAPYTAFGSAFGEFATVVANRGEDEVAAVRRAIRDALGSEASVLTRMIPGLEPLCGEVQGGREGGSSSEGAGDGGPDGQIKTKSADAMQRFQRFVFVFRTFLRTVATPEHPMVLLLDDIHFAVRLPRTLRYCSFLCVYKGDEGVFNFLTCLTACCAGSVLVGAARKHRHGPPELGPCHRLHRRRPPRESSELPQHEAEGH
jgi:energy-coupling factor transporter ATP-binding protein EcfA2